MGKNAEQLSEHENGNKLPENTKPSEKSDIQAGPESIKEAKLQAKKERFAFMDQIEAENSLAKLFDTSPKNTKAPPKTSGKFPSFNSTEGNRIIGDENKSALEGFAKSLVAPFIAVWNFISDTREIIRSPKGAFVRTTDYLKEVNPDVQNI